MAESDAGGTMTVYTNVTTFGEASSGDTENSDAIAGRRPSDANFPILSGRNATFSGTIGNSRLSSPQYDSDYFAIDVAGGSHDWSGSIARTANLNFKVQLSSPLPAGADFTIQYRLVDYNFLNQTGPYGKYQFYSQANQRGTGVLDASWWANTSNANAPSGDLVLVFQIVPGGYTGNYTITVTSGGGTTPPPPVQSTVDLSSSISLNKTSLKPGEQVTVRTTISNGGTAAAPSENVGYQISSDPTFATNVTSLGQIGIDPLGARSAIVYTNVVVPIPSDLRRGKYYIRAIADTDNRISETNEANNASKPVAITLLNRPPVVVEDHITISGSSSSTFDIRLNGDYDPDGDPLKVSAIVGQPQKGKAVLDAQGKVTYTPKANLSPADADSDGVIRDSLMARVSDGQGGFTDQRVTIDIKYDHFEVNLPELPSFSAPLVTKKSINEVSSPVIAKDKPTTRTLIGPSTLRPGATVTYNFSVTGFMTQYMDFHGNGAEEPSLKADSANVEPSLGNSRGSRSDIGFGQNPTWYDDPLTPGKYTLELANGGSNAPLKYEFHHTFAPDYAGNSPLWARDLGLIDNKKTASYAEYVSRGDGTDYYKFTLDKPGAVSIAFVTKNTLAPAQLYIDDAASLAAGSSAGLPTGFTKYAEGADFKVLTTSGRATALDAGTYYFHVDHPTRYDFDADYANGVEVEEAEPYKVFVTGWTDYAGNTSGTAMSLGAMTDTTQVIKESVSLADPNDWYRFDVIDGSNLSVGLKTTNKNFKVGLELARFNPVEESFTTVARAGADGNATGFGPNVYVTPGTYYVRVFANSDLTGPLIAQVDYGSPFIYPAQGGTDYQLTVTTKMIAPATPAAPSLAPGSDTGVSPTDRITKDATPTLTGTAEAGATVTLYEGTKVLGTGIAHATTGVYAITPASPLKDGAHKLTVKATDAAGNVSAVSAPTTISIDTRVPTPAITTKAGTVKSASVSLAGRGEAGSTVTLTQNGNATGSSVTVGSNGTWSAKITLAEGSNTLVATDTDKAGNVGTSAPVVLQFGSAAQASSLHAMVQAMAMQRPSAAVAMTPSAPATMPETHLAAAHA